MSKDARSVIRRELGSSDIGTITVTPASGVAWELVLPVQEADEPHIGYNLTKRIIDFALALTALVALSPLLVVVAIINARGGGVFYRQRRLGLCGKEFSCLKFRSMVPGAEELRETIEYLNITNGPTFKNPDDPRLTKFGRFLRRWSIDELPQLLNVLRGDMSLVGPRPLAVAENRYEGDQHQRLSVKPGLTCIWQVSGRSKVDFERWMQMDLDYVDSRSLATDLGLIVRTIPAVVFGEGAF